MMIDSASILHGDYGVVDPEKRYYTFELGMNSDGVIYRGSFTHWTGYADEEHRIELRIPSLVNATYLCNAFRNNGTGVIVVNDGNDLSIFFCLGGRGLVEESVATTYLADWLHPTPQIALEVGFTYLNGTVNEALKRAPRPKLRMKVLKRDRYRCRVCGRSPDNYSDLELHVHHIRPWAERGVSDLINLITLCHTCHKGLDPHWENDLYKFIGADNHDVTYVENYVLKDDVLRYREYSMDGLNEADV